MTTPEHALVGIHLALACGRATVWGWRAVALAGLMSNMPDWDGLPMLVNMARFEPGHRVWGHNLLSITLTSLLVAAVFSRWDVLGRIGNRVAGRFGGPELGGIMAKDAGLLAFLPALLVCLVSQTMHLPCDMVASGGRGLSHWHVKPFWPFSDAGFVYPMIPWGDVGPTVVMMAGVIFMARRRRDIAMTSAATLLCLMVYLLARRFVMS